MQTLVIAEAKEFFALVTSVVRSVGIAIRIVEVDNPIGAGPPHLWHRGF